MNLFLLSQFIFYPLNKNINKTLLNIRLYNSRSLNWISDFYVSHLGVLLLQGIDYKTNENKKEP
jgi:hypothetical protein